MMQSMQRIAPLAGILLALGVSVSEAHTLKGPLGKAKGARVKWAITCYAPATQMVVRLQQTKTTKSFKVDLKITSGNESLELESIPIKNKWTPYFSIKGGAAEYVLDLSKDPQATGGVTYVVDNHCETDTGVHTAQSNPKRKY